MNNSLLKDRNYIQIIKSTIEDTLRIYSYNDNDNNNTNNIEGNNNTNNNNDTIIINNNNDNYPQFTINDQLLLESAANDNKGGKIKFSSRKKKDTEKEEVSLEKQIKILDDKFNDNLISLNEK